MDRAGSSLGGRVMQVVVAMSCLALVTVGCASPDGGSARSGPSQGAGAGAGAGQAGSGAVSGGPKTLRMAWNSEPEVFFTGAPSYFFHAALTNLDAAGALQPQLAVKVPSVSDGDWKVGADGSMEVTWRLKPGLKWHDGAPVVAEDFAFAVKLFKDSNLPFNVPLGVPAIGGVQTPDSQTVVIQYSRINNRAAYAGTTELPPLPRHLLEEPYEQVGAATLATLPFWSTGWVGLGPYKMTGRTVGTSVEGQAFADYVLGRPKIEQVQLKYIFDLNAMMTNVMAGEIDAIGIGNFDAPQAATLRQQWASAGKGVVNGVPTTLKQTQLHWRDPNAPWASDLRVRQAMVHTLDRQGLVDSIMHGFTTVGHIALMPSDPAYGLVERRGLPTYPLDRARAAQLLDEAGWPRGADGIRRNAAGTVLKFDPADVGSVDDVDEVTILVDGFRASGFQSSPNQIDERQPRATLDMLRAQADGITRPANGADASYWNRYIPAQIGNAGNQWRGANTGGYVNPEVTALFERWSSTLETGPADQLRADFHKVLIDNLVYLPLYYEIDVTLWRTGLAGPKLPTARGVDLTWDVHTWSME